MLQIMTLLDQQSATRQRLLEAAGEVFAEHGYRAATVRQICDRAKANVAAVNYHFGDKAKLYAAALQYAHRCAMEDATVPDAAAVARMPAEQRLRMFVRGMLQGAAGEGRPAWQIKIMTREMSEPTEMLDPIVEHGIRPRFEFVKATIRDLLGGEPSEEQLRLTAWSIVGQILFYRFGRPVITRLYPPIKFDDAELDRIAEHITAFTLAALRGQQKAAS